eukprot:COSAG02_NODE_3297_length_6992_cov_9.176556_7_plen_73_part_00
MPVIKFSVEVLCMSAVGAQATQLSLAGKDASKSAGIAGIQSEWSRVSTKLAPSRRVSTKIGSPGVDCMGANC